MMDDTKLEKPSSQVSSRERILKNLKAKEDETSLFMSSFDPTISRTDKLKKGKNQIKKKKETDKDIGFHDGLYDDKGILLKNGVDLCDCLDQKVCWFY